MEELVKEQPVYEIQKVKIKNNQLTAEYTDVYNNRKVYPIIIEK